MDGDSGDESERPELAEHYELAEYVRAATGGVRRPTALWNEHAYSRERTGCGAGGAACGGTGHALVERRVLAVREPARCTHRRGGDEPPLDVVAVEPELRPPGPVSSDSGEEDDDEEPGWEQRLAAAAIAAHAGPAAERVLAVLREHQLRARATLPGARGEARREGARRLRRALAESWRSGARGLHTALRAHLPANTRRTYDRLVSRLPPALIARLTGAPPPSAPPPALTPAPLHASPSLLWVPSGRSRLDDRWEHLFRLLFPVQRVHFPPGELKDVDAIRNYCRVLF